MMIRCGNCRTRSNVCNFVPALFGYALTVNSSFPQRDYNSFASYYQEKYGRSIKNRQNPLLLVKGLSKKLNWLKPWGQSGKRRKDELHKEMEEHLIPELCVKHEFPAPLWIQASLLPSIVHRVTVLLQADELRCTIIRDSGLGSGLLASVHQSSCQKMQK